MTPARMERLIQTLRDDVSELRRQVGKLLDIIEIEE